MLKLFNSDCLKHLKSMDENSIDFVITSPPYNMNLRIRDGKYCSRQIVKEFSTKYEGFSDNLPIDQYFEFHKNVLSQLLRVTKKQIFYNIQPITGNKRALWKLIGYFSDQIKEIIIWDKKKAQPAMGEHVLNSQYEFIIVLTKNKNDSISRRYGNANFKRGTLSNVFACSSGRSKVKNFGASSPTELIDKIIINFTKENDWILDPFMGTGSMGESALKNKRNFYGIEIVEKYYKFCLDRLSKIKTN